MFRQLPGRCFAMHKYRSRMKEGFTLVETILAMALLLTVAVIIAEGFLSILRSSTYTTEYQSSANGADSKANKILSNPGSTPTPASSQTIKFVWSSGSTIINNKTIKVYAYQIDPLLPIDNPTSDNRHVFIYTP